MTRTTSQQRNSTLDMTMEDDMILSSMNSALDQERPGLFSKLFATNQDARVILKQKDSPDSSTCSEPKKKVKRSKVKSPARRRSASPEQIGKGLTDMAEAQANLGHWEKAFELWDEALKLQKDKLGPRHPTVATTLARRGSASAHLGQWYPAALDLEKAAHIFQSENDDVLASDTLIQLSTAQERMGHLDEAVTNMEMALVLKEKLQDVEGVARLNCLIGNVRHQQHDYERALQSYRVGLEYYEQAGVDKNHPHVVWATRRASDRSMQGHLFWSQARKNNTSG